jgi:hypothetical protein
MDPESIASMLAPAINEAKKALSGSAKRAILEKAKAICAEEPQSQERVRELFADAKRRLASTWKTGMFMTITLFVLFIGMAVTAVVTGLVSGGSPAYAVVFGGISASSLFTVVLWKPYNLMFKAAQTLQRLDIILVGLEEEWLACSRIEDPSIRAARILEANQAALREMTRLDS